MGAETSAGSNTVAELVRKVYSKFAQLTAATLGKQTESQVDPAAERGCSARCSTSGSTLDVKQEVLGLGGLLPQHLKASTATAQQGVPTVEATLDEQGSAPGRGLPAIQNVLDLGITSPFELHNVLTGAAAAEVEGALPLPCGSAAAQGMRKYMEDTHLMLASISQAGRMYGVNLPPRNGLFAIFDGHCGADAAIFARDHLLEFLLATGQLAMDPTESLRAALAITEEQLLIEHRRREALVNGTTPLGGTTALAALVLGQNLHVANLGDCRAVVCRRGPDGFTKSVALSTDHTPEEEAERIAEAGAKVFDNRINGELEVSRSLGDFDHPDLKRLSGPPGALIADAEVQRFEVEEGDEFMVMASDGFWKKHHSNEAAMATARRRLRNHKNPQLCAEELVQDVLARGTDDNVTVIVVLLGPIPDLPRLGSSRLSSRRLSMSMATPSERRFAEAEELLPATDSASSLLPIPGTPVAGEDDAFAAAEVTPFAWRPGTQDR
ncbi:hypothetical protein WJX72_003167 [[Myrmecia] bisecta]|uniref:PPM-type phosphatase domain-containing protein n=1 Tax=[Myrmecia] bisecta TaxID=41462 RepID=A0AAW1R5F9_9CHLO